MPDPATPLPTTAPPTERSSGVAGNPIPRLRVLALIEGVSFLILLGIAMPLKYLAEMPLAVKLVGWAHGVLFMLLCAALVHTWIVARWRASRALLVLAAALLPLGPFLLDRRMRRYAADFVARSSPSPDPLGR